MVFCRKIKAQGEDQKDKNRKPRHNKKTNFGIL